MAKGNPQHVLHPCGCSTCQQHPHSALGREHRRINRLVAAADERTRRLVAGFLARQHGRGGIALLARSPAWIATPSPEADASCNRPTRPAGRVRRPGGGPTRAWKKKSRILKALEELLADATAGDPISGMKWTHRSLRKLQKGLRRRGDQGVRPTIARLMRDSALLVADLPQDDRRALATRTGIGSSAT